MSAMELPFANRAGELKALHAAMDKGGLIVVFGRRRVGKTRLLTKWLDGVNGLYSQAIEAAPAIQVEQILRDIAASMDTPIVLKTLEELLELLRGLRFAFSNSSAPLCWSAKFPSARVCGQRNASYTVSTTLSCASGFTSIRRTAPGGRATRRKRRGHFYANMRRWYSKIAAAVCIQKRHGIGRVILSSILSAGPRRAPLSRR